MKISDYITNEEAQAILKHSHRTQIVLDAEAFIEAEDRLWLKTIIAEAKMQRANKKVEADEKKEPWEMTRGEFAQSNLDRILEISRQERGLAEDYSAMGSELVNPKLMDRTAKKIELLSKEKAKYSDPNWISRTHKRNIKRALAEGKPVPKEILAEHVEADEKEKEKDLKDIPFPECAKDCEIVKLLGVGECESVCPEKEK